jgi:hypothetical protein
MPRAPVRATYFRFARARRILLCFWHRVVARRRVAQPNADHRRRHSCLSLAAGGPARGERQAIMDSDPLQAIASRLLPLVQCRLDWWRAIVRRWASNPPRYPDDQGEESFTEGEKVLEHSVERGDGVTFGPRVLPVPFPDDSLTVDERIVLLGAIHDTYASGMDQIHPWRYFTSDDADGAMLDEYRLASLYRVLVDDRVPALREHWTDHQAKVEMFLADVERQFATTSGLELITDLLTTDELAWLAGVGKDRFLNVLSKARKKKESDAPIADVKGSGSRPDQFSYQQVRPFLLRKWQTRQPYFPESFADVKAFLSAQSHDD